MLLFGCCLIAFVVWAAGFVVNVWYLLFCVWVGILVLCFCELCGCWL